MIFKNHLQNNFQNTKKHMPVKTIGFLLAIIVIALFYYGWINENKVERILAADTHSKVINKQSDMPDKKQLANNGFNKSSRDNFDDVSRQSTADEQSPQEMSLLDLFHKSQEQSILKLLSDPESVIELPLSDGLFPLTSFKELNTLHEQQAIATKGEAIDSTALSAEEENNGLQALVGMNELNFIHQEQYKQSRIDNEWVSVPFDEEETESVALTMKDLDDAVYRQQFAADSSEVDDIEPIILPPSSEKQSALTNWDLIDLHVKQEEMIRQGNRNEN